MSRNILLVALVVLALAGIGAPAMADVTVLVLDEVGLDPVPGIWILFSLDGGDYIWRQTGQDGIARLDEDPEAFWAAVLPSWYEPVNPFTSRQESPFPPAQLEWWIVNPNP